MYLDNHIFLLSDSDKRHYDNTYKTLLITTLLIKLITVTLPIFYSQMTLLITANKKLASWIAGEEAELCSLIIEFIIIKIIISKVIISKVDISKVIISKDIISKIIISKAILSKVVISILS
jgi:hypothetical protein